MTSKEQELLSIIRDSKDPAKALQIAVEVILDALKANQEVRHD